MSDWYQEPDTRLYRCPEGHEQSGPGKTVIPGSHDPAPAQPMCIQCCIIWLQETFPTTLVEK